MLTTITLVRHSTTEWMEQGISHGRTDSPLSQLGKYQARCTAAYLAGRHFDVCYLSPIGRVSSTAQIIWQDRKLNPVVIDDLMEVDFGKNEGKASEFHGGLIQTINKIVPFVWLWWIYQHKFDMESSTRARMRVRRVLNLILQQHSGQHILVIGHTVIFNLIFQELFAKKWIPYIDIPPCGINQVQINGEGEVVHVLQNVVAYRCEEADNLK